MIKDKLLNSSAYYNLSERIKIGLFWLENTDLKNIADGKYLIDGDNVYASVQTYDTKDDVKYESHRRYIDIQYMIDGEEKIPAMLTLSQTKKAHKTNFFVFVSF